MIINLQPKSYKITSVGTSGLNFILLVTLDDKRSLEIYKDKFNFIEVKDSGSKRKKVYQFNGRSLSILPSSNKDRIYSEFLDIVKHILAGPDEDMINELKSYENVERIMKDFNLKYYMIGDVIEKGSIKVFNTPTGQLVAKYKGDFKFKILWGELVGKSVKFVEIQVQQLTVLQ